MIMSLKQRRIRFEPQHRSSHFESSLINPSSQSFYNNPLDDRPCDISQDWCGWKSLRGWQRIKYKELDQVYQDDDGDNNDDEQDGIGEILMYKIILILTWNDGTRLMQTVLLSIPILYSY